MIKSNTSISQVKEIIAKMSLKNVEVVVNLGRNKYAKFTGVLSGVYPALFTVKPFDKDYRGKTSYSYSEYLCGKVRLKETAENSVTD